MKMIISRLAILLGIYFAFLLLGFTAFCQPLPPIPPDPWLDSYSFLDTNWLSDNGYAPIAYTNLVSVPEWTGNALLLDTTNTIPAFLDYNIVEADGTTNLDFGSGAVACVFICDWASADTNQFGTGPGETGYLLAAGDFSSNSPDGLWAIYFDPGGTNIYFGGVRNSASTVFVSAPISWASNSIHLICVSYLTNSSLYLDGQLAATGGPVTIVPATNVWTNGFFVGSDSLGFEQARGVFWYLEMDNSNLLSEFTASYFTNMWPYISTGYNGWEASLSSFSPDFAPGSPRFPITGAETGSNSSPYTVTTNYARYTNFWISVTTSSTNALVSIQSTLSNLTYRILTNRNLATTNWGVWQTLMASNSTTAAPAISLGSNAMFFESSLVWSTGTNGLPDWWEMLYFNQLGISPTGNPSGDGIDNLNKYLMGLNPNIAYVSPLIVLPPAGDYVSTPAVTIFSLDGSTIKYTTNGSTPSSTNGMSISSGMPLTNLPTGSFTLNAWESGVTPNVVSSNTYTIIPGAPTFSIPSGAYVTGTTLQISCATTNAIVRYTTNGIDPTTNSVQIQPTNILTLTTNETIKAAAWYGGLASPVTMGSYIIQNPPSNDNFSNATVLSGTSGEAQGNLVNSTLEQFEITNINFQYYYGYASAAGSVWYKWTAPSNGNVFFNMPESSGLLYFPTVPDSNPNDLVSASENGDGSCSVTSNITYYVSEIYSSYEAPGPFTINWLYINSLAPVFTPPPGTYYAGQPVTISCQNPWYEIFYTVDGSNPTDGSEPAFDDLQFASGDSVTLYQTTTLNAVSCDSSVSSITSGLYTIVGNTNPTLTASAPILSPTNTSFATSLTITLTCTNTNSTIFYTLDGSVPSRASASVPSGGTINVTNSTDFNAVAWATNMNVSPVTTGWYAKNGVDSTGDGIPDSGALLIGADPFVSDANAVNPNPFAHGLDNLQVYQNQSVLLANNYSTENDGIPDWWLVQNGYSVTTLASALGANGQTLISDFTAGINPNAFPSGLIPGVLPPIDFHMVHGPSNSMVMVLDTIRTDMDIYFLFCKEADPSSPIYNETVLEEFPTNTAIPVSGQQWGRYFQMTNQLPAGNWIFTLQGINTNGLWSTTSSNTFGRYQPVFYDEGYGTVSQLEQYGTWTRYVGVPIPVVGYTNNNDIKEPILAQNLRALSDTWNTFQATGCVSPTEGIIFDRNVQPLITEEQWGTLTFQFEPNCADDYCSPSYYPVDFASYFASICATPDANQDCGDAYTNTLYSPFTGYSFPTSGLSPFETDFDNDNGNLYFGMQETNNPAGLEYLSLTYRIGSDAPVTLTSGQSNVVSSTSFTFEVALNTETPTFQTINYYFDGRPYPIQANSSR